MSEAFQAMGGLAMIGLAVLLIALGIYWVIFPWFVYRKMDKMIQHLAKIEKGIMAMPAAASSAAPGPAKPVIPPVPGKEMYHISSGDGPVGPYNREALEKLLERGTITKETYILKEGEQEWKAVGAVFEVA